MSTHRTILPAAIALALASCTASVPTPTPTPDYLAQGKTQGYTAAVAAQTAATPEQWATVANKWQRAIDDLDRVPQEDPTYAEAQAKRDEYSKNKLIALKHKSQGQVGALNRFNQRIAELDPAKTIISETALSPEDASVLVVTITPAFLVQREVVKIETAKRIQKLWASLSSPTEPDRAHIWLRTASGTKIGGSRAWAATSIYLE